MCFCLPFFFTKLGNTVSLHLDLLKVLLTLFWNFLTNILLAYISVMQHIIDVLFEFVNNVVTELADYG